MFLRDFLEAHGNDWAVKCPQLCLLQLSFSHPFNSNHGCPRSSTESSIFFPDPKGLQTWVRGLLGHVPSSHPLHEAGFDAPGQGITTHPKP